MERSGSGNSMIRAFLVVGAVMIALNRIAQEAPASDWLPVAALLALALLVWVWGWYSERRVTTPAAADSHAAPAAEPARTAPVAGAVRAAPQAVQPDDLKVIEGIGPKMAAALIAAGIDTFAKLSTSTEADLHAAVERAGMRFAPSIPTWAEQAAYAARGDWDGLKVFQGTLKGGRR